MKWWLCSRTWMSGGRRRVEYRFLILGKHTSVYSVNWEVGSHEMQFWRVKELKKAGSSLKTASSKHVSIKILSASWSLKSQAKVYQEPGSTNRKLLTKLHLQKIAYMEWKQVQDPGEGCRNIACMCRDDVGKIKARLQLWLERDIKSNKSNYCCIGTKSLSKENMDSVLSKVSDLVAADTDKAEMLTTCFCLSVHQRL